MNMAALLQKKMLSGKALGGHVFLNDPAISEALAFHGYDFVWIDAEHGSFDKQQVLLHVMAANAGGAAALVRVPAWGMESIKHILEMGIDGIIIPQITDEFQAKEALSQCLYPPRGVRGFGPRRAIRYNAQDLATYLAESERSFLRIIQVEHVHAVERLEAIITLDGLDALIIGPNDLASSIGLLGEPLHPEVLALGKRSIEIARKYRKPIGVSIGPDEHAIRVWKECGVNFFSCGDDISFIQQGSKQTIAMLQKLGDH